MDAVKYILSVSCSTDLKSLNNLNDTCIFIEDIFS